MGARSPLGRGGFWEAVAASGGRRRVSGPWDVRGLRLGLRTEAPLPPTSRLPPGPHPRPAPSAPEASPVSPGPAGPVGPIHASCPPVCLPAHHWVHPVTPSLLLPSGGPTVPISDGVPCLPCPWVSIIRTVPHSPSPVSHGLPPDRQGDKLAMRPRPRPVWWLPPAPHAPGGQWPR